MKMIQFGERCKHGLYCACYICDLEKENAKLKEENEQLRHRHDRITQR